MWENLPLFGGSNAEILWIEFEDFIWDELAKTTKYTLYWQSDSLTAKPHGNISLLCIPPRNDPQCNFLCSICTFSGWLCFFNQLFHQLLNNFQLCHIFIAKHSPRIVCHWMKWEGIYSMIRWSSAILWGGNISHEGWHSIFRYIQ